MGSARFDFRSANFIDRLTLSSTVRTTGRSRLRHLCALLALVVLALGGSSLARAQVTPVPTWTQQSPAMSPPARDNASMAYDAAHNQVVLFGGLGSVSTGLLNDTWTWDGTTWTQQNPAMSPSAREAFSMAYDAATGQVVLFGGEDNSGNNLNDTWTWDGTNWTHQNPANSPLARDFAAMAYDAASGQVVLFGGFGAGDLNDTWTWDGTTWTQQNPAMSPEARNSVAMTYDDAAGQVVLFGGIDVSGNVLGDTWTWNGTNWTRQSPVTNPPANPTGSLAYDAASGQVVLFESDPPETWTWDGTNWTLQSPATSPSTREGTAMAYDAASRQVLLFGGETHQTLPFRIIDLNDTWTLNVAVNLGSANVCLNGATTPSPCSQSVTLSFDVAANTNTTVGSINILTQGAANLDFKATSPDTSTTLCKAQTYTTETVCTVDVTFAPTKPGQRLGGVVLEDGSGNALANIYVFGTGIGPQATFAVTTSGTYLPSTQSVVGSGFSSPQAVAVDAAGDVFVADTFNSAVEEIVAVNGSIPASPTIKTLGSGFSNPTGVAVDGSGNVFVTDDTDVPPGKVKEIVAVNGSIPSSPTIRILGSGFGFPSGVAVDGSGDVFVTDIDNVVKEMVAVNGSVPASPIINTLGSGFREPFDVVVDGSGNVFVTDISTDLVSEIVAVNGSIPASPTIRTLASGFAPGGLAVDASGNVFVAGNGAVKEIVAVNGSIPASPTINTLGSGFNVFAALAVDGSGNVFIADANNNVQELNFSVPPSLSFAATNVGSQSSDSPQTVTVSNDGNAALTFPVPAMGNNPSVSSSFSLDSSVTCPEISSSSNSAGMLNAGASCTLPFDFIPAARGTINGTAVLTDNNLNQSGAMQTINLSGTGNQATQTITFNNPGSQVQGGMLNLMASATSGLAVSFASNTPLVCTVPVGGTTASLIAPGQCSITASQAGNTVFAAATPVTQVFTVTPDFVLTVTPSTTTASRPGNEPVVLKLMPVNGFKGPVTLSCILPAGVASGTKCPGLPTSVTLNGTSTVSYSTGVLFPNTTKTGTYVVTFTAVDGKFNDSTTATFNIK